MFEKLAEQFEQDVLARYQQKLAVLGGGVPGKGYETLRNAFRTMKSISDKYLALNPGLKGGSKVTGSYYHGKNHARRSLEGMIGYHNTNPKYNDIIKQEGTPLKINPNFSDKYVIDNIDRQLGTAGEQSLRKGQMNKLQPDKYDVFGEGDSIFGEYGPQRDLMRQISQEDIEKYLDARHTLYKFYHPESTSTSTYNDPNKLKDRMHLLYEGWKL